MSNQDRKEEGKLEEIGGKVRSAVGSAVGSERMRAEGEAQRARGYTRRETAKTAERGEGALQELGGKIKNRLGALFGNRRAQTEGRVDEIKGKVKQVENRPSAPSMP